MRLRAAPALSFVPDILEPPKGCWPTTAPVHLSFTSVCVVKEIERREEGGGRREEGGGRREEGGREEGGGRREEERVSRGERKQI